MPTTDFISNLFEIKDLIINNYDFSSDEIHIFFHLERRDVSCPYCNSVTCKVHDYRTSVLKMPRFRESDCFSITKKTLSL